MKLGYDRKGSGAPLVLIHPLGGSRGVWAPVIEPLAEHHDVIAVDMPGFGESPVMPAGVDPTPTALGGAVAEFLALELGIGRAHYVGNSLGGWAALELARRSDGAALSVTALCPAGLWGQVLGARSGISARSVARAALPLLSLAVRSSAIRRGALAMAVGHPERLSVADATALIRAYASAPGFDAANREMRSVTPFPVGRFHPEVPVTIAWGELDRMVRKVMDVGPGVRVTVLEDCGHMPMFDDPELVVQTILDTTQIRQETAGHG